MWPSVLLDTVEEREEVGSCESQTYPGVVLIRDVLALGTCGSPGQKMHVSRWGLGRYDECP